ncbi:MAG: lipoate--protein ligase [Thermoprotei archaeon]|nr:MAG: lipoate--protein ligase [Thermoprotei archaeon]
MNRAWRLLDTGLRSAAENMALDDVVLEAVASGLAPNTIRFLRFSKPCVLVGYHQDVDQEVRLEYCAEKAVEVNRRLTGGGAVYFEPHHLGWEVIARWASPFPTNVEELYGFICEPVVRALRRLGVNARFRPKNDIEAGSKKISGTGGTVRGTAFLFQGTLLTDLNLHEMLRCLRIPIKKLSDKEVESLKDRVTTLRWELGYLPGLESIKQLILEEMSSWFGIETVKGKLNPIEFSLLRERQAYFSSKEWIYMVKVPVGGLFHSSIKAPGGLVRAAVSVRDDIIQAAYITGDFFAHPQTLIYDLEAKLKHIPIDRYEILRAIESAFNQGGILGVHPKDIAKVVLEAAGKSRFLSLGLTPDEADCLIEVLKPAEYVLSTARYLLLPYCAKPLSCELRWDVSCSLCGGCDFKEVYEKAYALGFEPLTIVSYEHLEETLTNLKAVGEKAWIGSCCEAFYEKHYEDFEKIGLPGLIVTTEGLTCYDLGVEKLAYEGKYEGVSKLRTNLLLKVLQIASSYRGRRVEASLHLKL